MADRTGIEWTNATWQVTHGCTVVSPGCTNCYAMRLATRLERMHVAAYTGLTQPSKAGPVWTGRVRDADLGDVPQPLRWKKPRRIFVNSMSDLFHPDVSSYHIAHVFGIMACARQHTFQVLTKRPERMAALLGSDEFWEMVNTFPNDYVASLADPLARHSEGYLAIAACYGFPDEPLSNVWLGTSVEDQASADERIPHLLATPAALRFLSCEPLIGAISQIDLGRIDWVIAGGESGPGARPMHPDWVRRLRDQCHAASVPFFFKQWGGWVSIKMADVRAPVKSLAFGQSAQFCALQPDGSVIAEGGRIVDRTCFMKRVSQKRAGALLDGREHREFPR